MAHFLTKISTNNTLKNNYITSKLASTKLKLPSTRLSTELAFAGHVIDQVVSQSPTFHLGTLGLIPDQVMWDL
jgi:hypothetical protein